MKTKIFIATVCFFLLIISIISKVYFDDKGICGFYNICEWITYLFIVPTTYLIVSLFSKTTKPLKSICAIALGVIISILLNRDWATGFILQKLAATLLGSLIAYPIAKQFKEKGI